MLGHANRLETAKVLDFIQLSKKVNISKLMVPDGILGKTVLDINMRRRFGLNIIAIENGGSVIENVSPDYVFRTGDVLFLSGGRDGIIQLAQWTDKGR